MALDPEDDPSMSLFDVFRSLPNTGRLPEHIPPFVESHLEHLTPQKYSRRRYSCVGLHMKDIMSKCHAIIRSTACCVSDDQDISGLADAAGSTTALL